MIHNPRTCNAFHSACENIRDADPFDDTITVLDVDAAAEDYVRDGMSSCTCPPLFKHDCTTYGCRFLGTFEGRDLYVCNLNPITVIARRSDEGSDYTSGWDFAGTGHDPWLTEARRRAEANGYRA